MDMNVLQSSNYESNEICRICLGTAQVNLFTLEYENMKLVDVLERSISLKMETDENLPQQICNGCLDEIVRCYKFRQKCLETQELLLNQLVDNKDSIVKIEEEEKNNYVDENMIEIASYNSDDDIKPPLLIKLEEPETNSDLPKPGTVQCPICFKYLGNKSIYKHRQTHSEVKQYICDVCGKGFTNKAYLVKHCMIHTGSKPYKCQICNKGFIQNKSRKEHELTHTGETPHGCTQCGRRYRFYASLKRHLRSHKNVENQSTDLSEPQPPREHECPICHKFYTSKAILKSHMVIHGDDKKYLCSLCGKSFHHCGGYLTHLRMHQGIKPHACTSCDKTFSQISSLKRHELIHSGVKQYVCTICNNAFTQKPHLNYHMQLVHANARPFVCKHCGKAFPLQSRLDIHIRTHTGETPFVCDVCGKGFHESSSMKKHRRKQHEQSIEDDKSAIVKISNE